MSAYEDDISQMNRSVYSNLQSKIDKNRKLNAFMHTPQSNKLPFATLEVPKSDEFTDISKLKPREELAPLNLKNRLKIDDSIQINSDKDMRMANMNTNAYLYSKIPSKPKIKKSNIVSGEHMMGNIDLKATNSTKASLQHKSTASSLIATLGQRKRDTKSLNTAIYNRQIDRNSPNDRLDASPRVSIEQVIMSFNRYSQTQRNSTWLS
jgi:hypothetical protein